MICGIRLLLVLSIIPVFVGYWAHWVSQQPLPDGVEDSVCGRFLDEIGRIYDQLLTLSELVGVDLASWQCVRWFVNFTFRLLLIGWPFTPISGVQVAVQTMSGVPVYSYTSSQKLVQKVEPAIVYFHGGGWTWFSPATYDGYLRNLVRHSKVNIYAVEYFEEKISNSPAFTLAKAYIEIWSYRKAPEHPFPAAFRDCLLVTKHILNSAEYLGIDSSRVMVAGDGAGGNLAAAVAHQLKGKLFMQILFNPALQVFDFETPSYLDNTDVFPRVASPVRSISHWLRYANVSNIHRSVLQSNKHTNPSTKIKYFKYIDSKKHIPAYLNVTKRKSYVHGKTNQEASELWEKFIKDTRFSPSLATNVTGLPNAYIVTSQYDVYRDEGIMYSNRLFNEKVKIKLVHYKEAFHGFFLFSGNGFCQFNISKKALQDWVSFLNAQLLTE